MSVAAVVEQDPWFTPDPYGFNNVSKDEARAPLELEGTTPELIPEVITNVAPEPEPELQPAPEPEPEPEGPRVIQFSDNGYGTIEKSSKGWKGTVDLNGRAQNFYGKTKDELIENLLKAQFNASKLITEQKRAIKLGTATEVPSAVKETEKQLGRPLTPEESFEIKTQLETDPDKGLDAWFTKRTGYSIEQLVAKAKAGEAAQRNLFLEGVHKQFLANNPTWYADERYENYKTLLGYLAKHKLGQKLTATNQEEIVENLVSGGHYTVQNLDEAFAELTEDELLLQKPQRAPEPVPAPPAVPAAPPERIVRTETRPRAGLGLRSTETTPVPATAPKPPSAEDFENMTLDEINAAIAKIQRDAWKSRR